MTELELIDRQCEIINLQNEIIKKQAFYIKEIKDAGGAIEDMFEAERDDADNSIDFLESNMRLIHSTPANYKQVK